MFSAEILPKMLSVKGDASPYFRLFQIKDIVVIKIMLKPAFKASY